MIKLILKIFVGLLCLFNSIICLSQNQDCRICGSWRWELNDARHDFSIQVFVKNDSVVGSHCYILNSGDKMDCSAKSGDVSFKIKHLKVDSMTVSIRSYYSGKLGIVKLEIKNKKLYWKLIKAPKGEYYFPKEAILVAEGKN